jgi:hypothetical protein
MQEAEVRTPIVKKKLMQNIFKLYYIDLIDVKLYFEIYIS